MKWTQELAEPHIPFVMNLVNTGDYMPNILVVIFIKLLENI